MRRSIPIPVRSALRESREAEGYRVDHHHEVDRPGIMAHEVGRKLIHLAVSGIAAVIILLLPPIPARLILLGIALAAAAIEIMRRISPGTNQDFNRAFGTMLRAREWDGVTGATTLAAGFALTAFLAPPLSAAAAILIAGVGDSAAALVGRYFGRRRFTSGKSLEGSAACFIAGLTVALLIPGVPFVAALAAAIAITIIEFTVASFDDNLILAPAAALIIRSLAGL
jgi:dolichol kinase